MHAITEVREMLKGGIDDDDSLPALDEWAVMQEFKDSAGEVTLPEACIDKCKNDDPAFGEGFFCK